MKKDDSKKEDDKGQHSFKISPLFKVLLSEIIDVLRNRFLHILFFFFHFSAI